MNETSIPATLANVDEIVGLAGGAANEDGTEMKVAESTNVINATTPWRLTFNLFPQYK